MVSGWGIESCRRTLNSTAIKTVLGQENAYDLIVMEQFNTDCMMGIAWKLKLPVVALGSCSMIPWHFERFGNPQFPSYIPSQLTDHTDQMSYRQRLSNWISSTIYTLQYK